MTLARIEASTRLRREMAARLVLLALAVACPFCSSFAFVGPSVCAPRSTTLPGISELPFPTECSRIPTRLYLWGNTGTSISDSKEKELAFFPNLATTTDNVKFESLSTFIATWSQKFEDDRKGMGLTTPVKIFPLLTPESADAGTEDDKDVVAQGGVRIVFQSTKTGYKSKTEEDESREGGGEQKKKGPAKEGGVELRVEKLASGKLQLRAIRCEIDEDTMIKEMSEETIINELKRAIESWKKL
jgi:hypothetical protein